MAGLGLIDEAPPIEDIVDAGFAPED